MAIHRDETIEQILRVFYEKHLVVVADLLRKGGKTPLDAGEEKSFEDVSYYEVRTDSEPYIRELSEGAYAEELKRIWKNSGLEEMSELSALLISLAEDIREESDDDEVSSFIYAMY